MKIATDSHSSLYWGIYYQNEPTLELDGKPYTHDYVVYADEEAGTITVAKMEGSSPIFAGGRYITETITGSVKIIGEPKQERPVRY